MTADELREHADMLLSAIPLVPPSHRGSMTAAADYLRACADALDPPDGGDVSLLQQLQRMSIDAARYRLLRRKFAIISDGNGNAEFCPINLPRPTYIAPNTAIELDTALDRERLGIDGVVRALKDKE